MITAQQILSLRQAREEKRKSLALVDAFLREIAAEAKAQGYSLDEWVTSETGGLA